MQVFQTPSSLTPLPQTESHPWIPNARAPNPLLPRCLLLATRIARAFEMLSAAPTAALPRHSDTPGVHVGVYVGIHTCGWVDVCWQRLVRGQLARRRLKSFLDIMAAVRLQRVLRGHMARRAVRHIHVHRAYVHERTVLRGGAAHGGRDRALSSDDGIEQGASMAAASGERGQGGQGGGSSVLSARYWDDGGAGYLVGSWANALWAPPDLKPKSPGLDL